MKFFGIPAVLALLASSAAAHSWLECVDTVVENKQYAIDHPKETLKQTCKGYPRNKVNNGDWIAESSNYAYGFNTQYACRDGQRAPGQAPGAPMATVTPGQTVTMRFWGNGHTRWDIGSPNHRDPGLVRVFWAGKPETEIVYLKDLNEKYWIPGAQGNFSAKAVNEISADGKHMNEKANYFEFTIPKNIQNGRHMMVWSWAWKQSMVDGAVHNNPQVYDASWDNAWGTCFDITVKNSKFTGVNTDILANKPGFSESKLIASKTNAICSKTCLRGGQVGQECTGASCPPCWYANGDAKPNCFAYASGTTCPWNGGFDCKKGTTIVVKRSEHRRHRRRTL